MHTKKLFVFATGNKELDGTGGSGFANLVNATRTGILDADITVVSNHESGSIKRRALELGIPFFYFAAPFTPERYQDITKEAEFVTLSGWLKFVTGLNPRTTFNIHPAPLPQFGGKGVYGHRAHELVMQAFNRGEITHSAMSMHYVIDGVPESDYDKGPVFFQKKVEIIPGDTADSLAPRVNAVEHEFQPIVTQAVLEGKIGWDGKDPDSLFSPYL